MKVILVFVALVCIVVGATSINMKYALQNLNQAGKEQLCKQIGHKSHQLMSPFRYVLSIHQHYHFIFSLLCSCMEEGEDLGAAGKKFKATHNINADTLNPVVLLPGILLTSIDYIHFHHSHFSSYVTLH